MPKSEVLMRALSFLARREHGEQELINKLVQRGISQLDAETVVAECKANGWQSDARFAEHYIRHRANAGFGPQRIRLELLERHIASCLIDTQLEACGIDWQERANQVAMKKYGANYFTRAHGLVSPFERVKKVEQFLYKRGFEGVSMHQVVDVCNSD